MQKLLPFLLLFFAATSQSDPPKLSAEDKLKALFANSVVDTRWCTTKNGKMSDEYQDLYRISGAKKTGADRWTVDAVVAVLGRDVTVPVPVRLTWAGETPVVTLEQASIPGFGKYSARVLVFQNTFAGVWSANGRSGMIHGTIEKRNATPAGREIT
jgi:hypothetical protein